MGLKRIGRLLAVVVAVCGFVVLLRANRASPITDDGIRDQLFARDCVVLSHCHQIGAGTSIRTLYQGADWIGLLVLIEILHGGADAQRLIMIALNALAIVTLFLVVWEWLRPAWALPAAIIATVAMLLTEPISQLINPSAVVFPDIVCASALLAFAISRQSRFLLAAAFSLGMAIDMHLAALALLPAVVVLSILGSGRPGRSLSLALLVLALTLVTTSWQTWYVNGMDLAQRHRLGWPAGALILAGFAAAAVSGAFRRLPRGGRAAVAGVIMVLPFLAGTIWVIAGLRRPFAPFYIHPVIGPGAVVAVALVHESVRRTLRAPSLRSVPTVAVWGVVLVALGFARPRLAEGSETFWTVPDAERIAAWSRAHGWSYEDTIFRVQGPHCRDLAAAMAAYFPPPGKSTVPAASALRAIIPSQGDVFRGAPFPHAGGQTVVVSEVSSWLRPQELRACSVLRGAQSPQCASPDSPPGPKDTDRFVYVDRAFPAVHKLNLLGWSWFRYEIPVVPDGPGARTFEVFDTSRPECRWQIAAVENLTTGTPLPASRVRLVSSGVPGRIVLEKLSGPEGCLNPNERRDYPPCLLETRDDESLVPPIAGSK